jgi:hypothetical protein
VTVLEERGLFWWHGEPVPDTQFAADASVQGLLSITDDGSSTLALDGCLPSDKRAWAVLSRDPQELKGKLIEGILISSGKHVLLLDLARHGGYFRSNNVSQDGFRAIHCLITDKKFPPLADATLFNSLDIDLAGYEAWLRLGSINSVRTESTITVEYQKKDTVKFDIDEGRVFIKYAVLGPMLGSHRDDILSLKEKAYLVYSPNTPLSLDEMRHKFRSLEDLFIILTNSDCCFVWPTISLAMNEEILTFEWYSYRHRSGVEPPRWHECTTNFVGLREVFGQIVSNWMAKRKEFGPGFYLYIGIRRNWRLYIEHLFVNLIWGLEALHRKKNIEPANSEIKERVARLLDCIVDDKDKKWLKKRLKHAHEPNLEQRLFEVIESVPLNITAVRLRSFASRCARIRNDVSHFGEQSNDLQHEEFMEEVSQKARALSTLYYLIILSEIGVDTETINDWVYVRSFQAKVTLVEAGLLDHSVLRPQATPVAREVVVRSSPAGREASRA